MYLCTVPYLQISKCNIRNSFSPFICLILMLVSPVRESSSNQPKYLDSICRCVFFPFGIYPDGIFHRARHRRLPIFPGEKSKWDCRKWSFDDTLHPKARYERSSTFTISKQFSNSLFPQKLLHTFQTRPRLFCRQHAIRFEVGVLKKPFCLRTNENGFFNLGLAYEWNFFFALNSQILRLLFFFFVAFTDILINPGFM